MKTFPFILLFVTTILIGSCNKSKDSLSLFPVKLCNKWGYVDATGKYVINPQFVYANAFSDGLALVVNDNMKMGFIGIDGKYRINPIYDYAASFSEGLACVLFENGKPQFIDQEGNIVFQVDFLDHGSVLEESENEGFRYYFVDNCTHFEDGLALVNLNEKFGFIDKKGKLIINPIYDYALDFNEGFAAVATTNIHDEIKWGYIDKSGKIVIDFQFNNVFDFPGSFNEGLASVSSDGLNWGYINKEGKYEIQPQFESYISASAFINGLSLIFMGGKFGYIDKKGNIVINPVFELAEPFFDKELAVAQSSNNLFGYINRNGNFEINPQYELAFPFIDGIAFVKVSGKYGIIDKNGSYIVNPQFDDYIHNYNLKFDVLTIKETILRLNEQLRLDSIRIYDSIALVEAEQARIQDSINAVLKSIY